jgi:xylulose-5-phosphate/fructose-6-phosphate phosphoketolase
VVQVWFPPDANTTLTITDQCLRSTNHVNLIVVDKQKHLQYLTLEEAHAHCAAGAGVWDWASTCGPDDEPDIVLACAGDVPTQEALAAVELLAEHVPDLRVRFVNVVDLMALLPENDHPNGFADSKFDDLFTQSRHVVFAFHGYPRAVHQLIHGRSNPGRFHVRGFNEQGTTTTPFDMVVLNRMSRFHLALEVLRRADRRVAGWEALTELCERRLAEHRPYIEEHLEDLPDIAEWSWRGPAAHAATDGPGR